MTLVNARAAFEKSVSDKVTVLNNSLPASGKIVLIYDNVLFALPSKTKKYVAMSVSFTRSVSETLGAGVDFYLGTIDCSIFIPKNKGTSDLSSIGEAVIDGLTAVNASNYVDTYGCKPRTTSIAGPSPVELVDDSHFMGIISCQFSANA